MEVFPLSLGSGDRYVVELEASGSRLRVELHGEGALAVASLVRGVAGG